MTMADRYQASDSMLVRAEQTIPLGSQTFSKSRTAFPAGASPLFAESGAGSRITDVDGNEYVDLVCALGAVTLGYCDRDVDAAVAQQLARGVTLSLSHRLEHEVAERLVELVPCAEKVRFGKNGSDATSAAVRLARAYTGRDIILVCGYHGWHDWYIGSTARSLGVPEAVRALTVSVPFGDLEAVQAALAENTGNVAALIMEPMVVEPPESGYLQQLKTLLHQNGSLLIFDEIVTGFRLAIAGAQELFEVTPDLACFGKGIANGHPLSAVLGRAEIMDLMEEIFVSGTFGGETLSLAAASAVIDKYTTQPVIETLAATGRSITAGVSELIDGANGTDFLRAAGRPEWSMFAIDVSNENLLWDLRTLYLQEMARNGVLTLGRHNVSYAFQERDIQQVLDAYARAIPLLVAAHERGSAAGFLECEPLRPLFTIR